MSLFSTTLTAITGGQADLFGGLGARLLNSSLVQGIEVDGTGSKIRYISGGANDRVTASVLSSSDSAATIAAYADGLDDRDLIPLTLYGDSSTITVNVSQIVLGIEYSSYTLLYVTGYGLDVYLVTETIAEILWPILYTPKYFVDATLGADTNDGLTAATAWKTTDKVNLVPMVAGDVIGFKSGETFTGQLDIDSGSVGSPVVYTIYGGSVKPILTESTATSTISAPSKTYFTVYGLDVRNDRASSSGFRLSGVTPGVGITIQRCDITSVQYGIHSSQPNNDLLCDHVNVYSTSGGGIRLVGTSSSDITVSNCTTNDTGGITLANIENTTVTNCTTSIQKAGTSAVVISACTGVLTISGCRFSDPSVSSQGIEITISSGITSGLISNCIANMTSGIGFLVDNGSANFSIENCVAYDCSVGFKFAGASNTVTVKNCYALECSGDGFVTTEACHDIDFWYCRASYCGDKTTTGDGDGFTTHVADYNIDFFYCIADYNTASGWALTGTSSGLIYGCLAYKNAGDWSGEGGADQVRGGFYLGSTTLNAVSGVSWVLHNCISEQNYPRELLITDSAVVTDLDYNLYYALDADAFASLDGVADISWATYSASYEANSDYSDPLLNSLLAPQPGSPAIGAGETLVAAYDDGLDASTDWGDASTLPVVVTKQQTAPWDKGAYVS